MYLDEVREGLATAARVIGGLQAKGYLPDVVNPPLFVVGDITVDYLQTYGSTDGLTVICRVLVARADDRSGQAKLTPYASRGGESSVKAALEANPSLGGACDDLVVARVRSPLVYTVGADQFWGAEFTVKIVGD